MGNESGGRAFDFLCLSRKYLVYNLVAKNLKVKYRFSILGFLWTLLVPLSQALVYYMIFNIVLKIQIPHYLILILCGVLPWGFFSQTIMEGVDSIVGNGAILSKVPIPPQIFSFAGAITNLISLMLSTPVLLIGMYFSGVPITWNLMLLPYFWLCLFLIAYGLSLILGLLYVYLRDLKHVVGILIQLWFYATPVLYLESMIPVDFRWLLSLNPVGEIFVGFHKICLLGEAPEVGQLLAPFLWSVVIFLSSAVIYKLFSGNAVETL